MAKNEIILVNTGVCVVATGEVILKPGEEMLVSAKELELPGFEDMIFKGVLTVKDNSAMNAEIVERARGKTRKDPDEGKTKKQLEDGGEYE